MQRVAEQCAPPARLFPKPAGHKEEGEGKGARSDFLKDNELLNDG